MRTSSMWATTGGTAAVLALGMTACGSTTVDCEDVLTCGPGEHEPDAGAMGSEASSVALDARGEADASGGDGDSDASSPVASEGGPLVSEAGPPDSSSEAEAAVTCDLEHAVDNGADAGCVSGVFVSPSGDAGAGSGTRSLPFHSIMQALTEAAGKPVFVCDDGKGYSEQLVIGASLDGANLNGSYSCSTWMRGASARARLHPLAGSVLSVQGLTKGLTLENFELSAVDATVAGASSIAVTVDASSNVVLTAVRIVAGKGASGAAGQNGAAGAAAPEVDVQQHGARATCPGLLLSQNGGAWGSASGCGSRGGQGGQSIQGSDGTPGVPGTPRDAHVHPLNVNNRGPEGAVGGDGLPGSDGDPGANGVASAASGSFAATGYTPAAAGANGNDGWVAQGGGGGGASNATALCIGASGGAGGMGGCAGKFGTGGGAGGASVALLTFASSVRLDRSDLVSNAGGGGGKGGNGGSGGMGQQGAAGGDAYAGDAGVAIGKGGNGGSGGNGGPGGSGAGGNGGPSYAIVYSGDPPLRLNGTTLTYGSGGAPGVGGSTINPGKADDGTAGVAAEQFAVPVP